MVSTQKNRAKYLNRISNGQCGRCGKKKDPSVTTQNCNTCRMHYNESQRKKNKYKKSDNPTKIEVFGLGPYDSG